MARIAVIGGTGYAGGHIVKEAAERGHTVVSVARKVPSTRVPGVTYLEGSLLDATSLAAELVGVDAVVVTVAPRGDMEGRVRGGIAQLAEALPEGTRLGVIGGAGGSLVAEGGPRLVDAGSFPDEFKPEALEMIGVLDDLKASDEGLDWFFVHPAAGFGGFAPGERTGSYRTGGEVLVTGEDGQSYISGDDFAIAVVDEIENPRHRRTNFTVGY
ncbi:NAD(P)H-binding protein [Microbacterium sp. MEC084]|uniref:NAD(P)-dependent oxidoreductase n=1 Tax=unclassified Microbacterium TaxID=2609290 RepID=UPI0006F6B73B|nr:MULTISPECIES: NAD(P)H-binding protein [unclassified Microbacterium]KQY96305.1 NAD-dependent epimerase [Microbacterium sp. Root53]MCD1268843.1 NAD(P)H-binding protein [Microbacterium sp. MEC084]